MQEVQSYSGKWGCGVEPGQGWNNAEDIKKINSGRANKLKMMPFLQTTKVLLVLTLLFCLTSQALNQQADAAIKAAIKEAVIDGLTTVDAFVRKDYWFFLQGTQRISFNVRVEDTHLNYILLYKFATNIFRVNVDLDKIKWKPRINSFVKVLYFENKKELLQPGIRLPNSTNQIVDLTDEIKVSQKEIKGRESDAIEEAKKTKVIRNDVPQVITLDGENVAPNNGIVIITSPPNPSPAANSQPSSSLTSELTP